MRIHFIQHVPFEGLGSIEDWAKNNECTVSSTKMFEKPFLPDLELFDWLIVLGGPMSVNDGDTYSWLVGEKEFIYKAIDDGKRVLGICLGAQLIANVLGAKVYQGVEKEIGWFPIEISEKPPASIQVVFPDKVDVFHWHGETFDLPEGAVRIAKSAICENQGFVFRDKVIGLQFHLESTIESVKKLVRYGSAEIIKAPYIQTADVMLEDEKRSHTINKIMNNVLNYQLNI